MKGKKLTAWILLLIVLSMGIPVLAQTDAVLRIPAMLQIIEEEAFCGCTAIFRVEVPEGITEIRSRAFAESTLHEISLPGSLVYIADDAFMGCLDFCVEAEEGTYAYNWAEENGWPILNPVDETPEPSESIRPTATPAPEQGEDELPWV